LRHDAGKTGDVGLDKVVIHHREHVVQVRDLAQSVLPAQTLANNRPGTVIWCMGGTQHTNGNNNTRAYCVLQLALGNMGTSGGGTNIFRGHDNVQGATDLGVLSHTLPGYYGLSAGSWAHWARVWGEDGEWLSGQFAKTTGADGKEKSLQNLTGIPVSRWIDGVLEDPANMDNPNKVRAMVLWGHAPNSQTRQKEMKTAMEQLDMLVVVDPYPTVSAVLHDRTDGVYLLPACTQLETRRSVTASNRSLQWRDKVVDPLFGKPAGRGHHGQVRQQVRLGRPFLPQYRDGG